MSSLTSTLPRVRILTLLVLSGSSLKAQGTPVLRQETLGSTTTNIANSTLDLAVRNTQEVDPVDLDGDGDIDLLYCNFYLFNPPLDESSPPHHPVLGSGGVQLFLNKTSGPGGQPEQIPGPPFPDPGGTLSYSYARGSFVDGSSLLPWSTTGVAPCVADADFADFNNDGHLDIVLACGTFEDPASIQPIWSGPEQHLAQNRILMWEGGVFVDRTFGQDGVVGGTGNNRDRLPLSASNTGGVAIGDINGDGFKDIVFAEYGPSYLGATNVLLLDDGTGHFAPPPGGTPFNLVGASADVEIADIDNDADMDVVFANANPVRAPVVTTAYAFHTGLANPRREEIWKNTRTGVQVSFQIIVPPNAPGLPIAAGSLPYADRGFWSDTRSVCIGDIDKDGDKDILFSNSGWIENEPTERNNRLIYGETSQFSFEYNGQCSQLLLNMGNLQGGVVPKSGGGFMGLNDFLDVGYYALPWNRSTHMTDLNPDGTTTRNPNGGVRVMADFELTGAQDVGGLTDLLTPYSGGFPLPSDLAHPDTYPDLLVARGLYSLSTVYINSGNWSMAQNTTTGMWYTKGRFFRGDVQLLSSWADVNGSKNLWEQQAAQPYSDRYPRFDLWKIQRLQTTDGDWADIDSDGRLDIVTANGDDYHGQINTFFLNRGLRQGFRWAGPSDEGALYPYVNTVLAYGVDSGDVDQDGDVDIVVAGVPTALALRNRGGSQEGIFDEHTFQDTGGGWLPYTGKAPLYAPLLTETVCLFDGDGTGYLEMLFAGYPPYDSLGNAYHLNNEAEQWHFYDPGYYNAVYHPTQTPPILPHCTFYAGAAASLHQDRTLALDPSISPSIPWMDRSGRIYENIADEARAADLDNDGDQDVVVAYRNLDRTIHPDQVFSEPPGTLLYRDPNLYQVVLSLWMNDGSGHLKDEAVARMGPSWQSTHLGADNYFWDALAGDRYEGLAFADVDSDGDLDMLACATTSGVSTFPSPYYPSRLFINMGGAQQGLCGGPYRTGQFRVAGLPGGPLGPDQSQTVCVESAPFGVQFDTGLPFGDIELEVADFDRDDDPDFAVGGPHAHNQFFAGAYMTGHIMRNNGNGSFTGTDFAEFPSPAGTGVLLDAWFNHEPTAWDGTFSVEPGDFDGDGDMDAALVNADGNNLRLLENTSTGPNALAFTDRSATGAVANPGDGGEDAISWVYGWASDGIVDDFNGDGLHDLYVGNTGQTTQDEILYSTAPDRTGPWLSGVIPENGQTTGRTLTLRGVNLAGVDTVWFERGTTSVTASVVSTTGRQVTVAVPASAPLGFGRVYVGNAASPGTRSNAYTYSHLDASPVLTHYAPVGSFGFKATDADGTANIGKDSWIIRRIRGGATTTWTAAAPGPWTRLVLQGFVQVVAPNSTKAAGDVFLYEIGDAQAAYGFRKKTF